MMEVLAAAAAAFVSTNLDDIFILMLLFAQAEKRAAKGRIVAGQYLGLGALTAGSMLCALGLGRIPQIWLRLLGLVPMALALAGSGKLEKLTRQVLGRNFDKRYTFLVYGVTLLALAVAAVIRGKLALVICLALGAYVLASAVYYTVKAM